jgi:hypothetical protein
LLALLAVVALHVPALNAQFHPERACEQGTAIRQRYPDPSVAWVSPGFRAVQYLR